MNKAIMLGVCSTLALGVAASLGTGCGQHTLADHEDRVASTSQAITTTSVTCTSRDPSGGHTYDNHVQTCTQSTICEGPNCTGTLGICYITDIVGSFRGRGDEAIISADSNGYYEVQVEGTTAYDGQYNMGPNLTMSCNALTDMGASSTQLANFSWGRPSAFAESVYFGGVGHTDSVITKPTTDWLSGGGVNGYLHDSVEPYIPAGGVRNQVNGNNDIDSWQDYNASDCEDSVDHCSLIAYSWQMHGSSESFTFDSTYHDYLCASGATGTDPCFGVTSSDCALASSSTSICWIDDVEGYWDANAEAKISANSDGTWHLKVTGDGSGGCQAAARATCMAVPQSW
jgi:hypothetical protein